MTGIIDEDECLFLSVSPIVTDLVSQIYHEVLQFGEATVVNLKDVSGSCTQSLDATLNVSGIFIHVGYVLEIFESFNQSQLIV